MKELFMSRPGFHTITVVCTNCGGTGLVKGLDRRLIARIERCERCLGRGSRSVERLVPATRSMRKHHPPTNHVTLPHVLSKHKSPEQSPALKLFHAIKGPIMN